MIKSIVINNLKKIYNYVLTHSYNYDIFISTKQKAVAPTKNEPPPIKKKGKENYNTVLEKVQDYGKYKNLFKHLGSI